ncbi:dienelactone hydrolase family protein [Nocardia puris]|uniref:Carboxymethylenebutenolidase n=1 Tax=Nocardia puris TaxID=208602 RepID=A0A366D0M2_9NOCA|nr:dienelactone hydrolase family protein [Nocardia puris]MBF6215133.1 dienelactone hydrolase family protein [Nocardia puris]MBF6369644.1 dienelactone hydrolase family protein [Nocardia puris]MBF6462541.1 dienelactone hydrolase family protein [Nocardia puris]RBO83630.1 carboxymethylenebutenolidase [Nocardia puris]
MPHAVTFRTLDVPALDGAADAYLARPDDGTAHPGVLLIMDAFGLRPRLGEMAEEIAARGYTVLAPNVFYRTGRAPVLPMPDPAVEGAHAAFFAALGPAREALTPDRAIGDIGRYLDWLDASEFVAPGPLAVTGYCMGGRLALRAAAEFGDRIAAAASFHGGRLAAEDRPDSPHHAADRISAELFIAHADADQSMPPEQIARLDRALEDAGVRHTSVVYEGARHGFTMSDIPPYDEAAARRHFTDLFALLDRALSG